MKFIKWVIEVRPFRLLVDCIAAYSLRDVSPGLQHWCSDCRIWLTDSAAASSSASLGRLWPLCCFLRNWLFLAVDDIDRDVDPAPKLPEPPTRRCVWPSTPKEGPLCDCEGEGVWDGLDAFFEARERGEFADMAFN